MRESLTMALRTPEQPAVAFDALYRSSMSDVFAYVLTLVRDRALAEDVVAAAFERAWRRRSTFDGRRGSERAWLFGIARNAALDELRRRKRTAALAVDPEDAAASAALEGEDPDAAARRAAVRAALAGLDPRERELVALKFFGGLSTAEMAAVLGCSERAAAMRVHRAVTSLREACHVPA